MTRVATVALLSLCLPGLVEAQEPAVPAATGVEATPEAAVPESQVDEERVQRLVEALRGDDSFKVRLQAAVLLGRMGDERVFEPLVAALSSDDHYTVRAVAAMALANLGDPRAISHIIKRMASDPDPFVRDEAQRALGAYDREQALPYVVASFRSEDPFVRKQALAYLAEAPTPATEPVVVQALGDTEEIFTVATGVISELDTGRALALLESALDHRDPGVRAGAVRVLHSMATADAAQLILKVYERDIEADGVRNQTRAALRDLRRFLSIEQIVKDAVSDPQKHTRAKALKLLGVLGGQEAHRVLLDALVDDDVYVRGTAVMAMAELGDPSVVADLEKLEVDPANQRILHLVRHTLKQLRKKHSPGTN